MSTQPKNIVIVGAGIIGCTTAYYLSRHPAFTSGNNTITIIEASQHGPAQGASGKAGGLVAKWAYPKEIVRVSFEEHVKLAKEHDGAKRWGWREVEVGTWEGNGDEGVLDRKKRGKGVGMRSLEKKEGLDGEFKAGLDEEKSKGPSSSLLPVDLDWMEERLTESYASMAPTGSTAQVHPYLFTTSMHQLATSAGVQAIQGRVTAVSVSSGRVTGVTYHISSADEPTEIPATDVIICAGAWSPTIHPLTKLPITHTRAHSITIQPQPGTTISPYVLFTSISLPSPSSSKKKTEFTPEIYARPNNEIYVCGPGDDEPLPGTVDDVKAEVAACDAIWEQAASVSVQMREGVVDRKQACFLPLGGPILGEVRGMKGLVVATGHTCWVSGICSYCGEHGR